MTYYYPRNRVPGPSRRPEITAPDGLTYITSAGQRASDAAAAAGGKNHRAPGALTAGRR